MSSPHKQPPARVPTLTEVVALETAMPPAQTAVALPADAVVAPPHDTPARAAMPGVESTVGSAAAGAGPDGAEDVTQRVVEALRPWVDSIFEQRLREALTPGLDALLQELLKQLRGEFDPLLREAVSRALAHGASKPPVEPL